MSSFVMKNNVPKGVTKEGLAQGLNPEITEDLQKAINSGKEILQPLDETPRQTKVVDRGIRKETEYRILRDQYGFYRGFAYFKQYEIKTPPYKSQHQCGKNLMSRIDLTIKAYLQLKRRGKKWTNSQTES